GELLVGIHDRAMTIDRQQLDRQLVEDRGTTEQLLLARLAQLDMLDREAGLQAESLGKAALTLGQGILRPVPRHHAIADGAIARDQGDQEHAAVQRSWQPDIDAGLPAGIPVESDRCTTMRETTDGLHRAVG